MAQKSLKDLVLKSMETPEGDRCVDLFRRPDGTCGFEVWRRDPEAGRWIATGGFADVVFDDETAALMAAQKVVPWLSSHVAENGAPSE